MILPLLIMIISIVSIVISIKVRSNAKKEGVPLKIHPMVFVGIGIIVVGALLMFMVNLIAGFIVMMTGAIVMIVGKRKEFYTTYSNDNCEDDDLE